MGPVHEYCAAFRDNGVWPNWPDVAHRGFDGMWSRFGAPRILSVQDYLRHTVEDEVYSAGALAAAMPPGPTEFVVLYGRLEAADWVGLSFNGPLEMELLTVFKRQTIEQLIRVHLRFGTFRERHRAPLHPAAVR